MSLVYEARVADCEISTFLLAKVCKTFFLSVNKRQATEVPLSNIWVSVCQADPMSSSQDLCPVSQSWGSEACEGWLRFPRPPEDWDLRT